jgi:hypothetical protein
LFPVIHHHFFQAHFLRQKNNLEKKPFLSNPFSCEAGAEPTPVILEAILWNSKAAGEFGTLKTTGEFVCS